jgi:DNA-binding NtrC family response regulator
LLENVLPRAGAKNLQFTPEALSYLETSYDWPGNVRELRVLIRRLAMEAKMPFLDKPEIETFIQKSESAVENALPNLQSIVGDGSSFESDSTLSFDENVSNFEKFLLAQALKKNNTSQARDVLKLSRTRFYEKLKQYGLQNKHESE